MKSRTIKLSWILILLLSLVLFINCELDEGNPTDPNANNCPNEPSNPYPADETQFIPIDVTLSWTGGDPDEDDTVRYDVYLSTSNDLDTPVSEDQLGTTYTPGNLEYHAAYYWQVVATDNHDSVSYGSQWVFATVDEPEVQEGVFAALVVGRQVMLDGPEVFYHDQIVARFDSAFAPCSTITPLQADTVRCNNYLCTWEPYTNTYTYTDPSYQPFIEHGQRFIFDVDGSAAVPSLIDTITFLQCSPYITNLTYEDTVSFSGFDVEWDDYCSGDVRFILMYDDDSTGVDISTTNDGSYSFTSSDLSPADPVAGEYTLIMIFQNAEAINQTGYDSRGYIWARTMNYAVFQME